MTTRGGRRCRRPPLLCPLPPAPSPLVPRGEGENCGSRGSAGITLAPDGPPIPGPSPINCMGEGRIRSRFDTPPPVIRGSAAPHFRPPERKEPCPPRHPSPEVGGGVDGRCEERAKRPSGERARRRAATALSAFTITFATSPHLVHPPASDPSPGRQSIPASPLPIHFPHPHTKKRAPAWEPAFRPRTASRRDAGKISRGSAAS
jgi:hypothetical protein